MSGKGKRLVAVRGDLLSRAVEIANRERKAFYDFTNEIFEQAIKAYEMKASLPELVEFYELVRTEQEAGCVLISADIANFLLEKLSATDRELFVQKWRELGQQFGKCLATKFREHNPIDVLKRALTQCSWGITSAETIEGARSMMLRCVAPYFSPSYTKVFSEFLKAALHELGFEVLVEDSRKGIIILEIRKQGG